MLLPSRRLLVIPASLSIVLASCGSDEPRGADASGGSGGRVVVTYSILGDVVRQLVGSAAEVDVIIPNGQDPHDYEPSAKDVQAIQDAALVVVNGFDLEEALSGVVEQAGEDGVEVFVATDHLTVRELGSGEPSADEHGHEEEHEEEHEDEHEEEHEEEHGGGRDPHFWTDPTKMAELAPDLSATLERVLGVELDAELAAFEAAMVDLDRQVSSIMADIPDGGCRLVTGHDSLGYFAERYGCTLVGAVIPSLSSSAETSAEALAELHAVATEAGVRVIFTEAGTPDQIAEQVAEEVGVPLVELPSHEIPDAGGYAAYVTGLARTIAEALAA